MANADKVLKKKTKLIIGGKSRDIELSMYSFCVLEDINNSTIGEFFEKISQGKQSLKDIMNLGYVALMHYDDINSPEEFGRMIPLGGMNDTLEILMNAVNESMEGTPKN